MITRLSYLAFGLIALASQGEAQTVDLTDRAPFETTLQGLVDFDDTSASPFPGTPYRTRIPFRGLIADTYFAGQIPIRQRHNNLTYGANFGMPANPLKEGILRQRYSQLHIVSVASEYPGQTTGQTKGAFLVSRINVQGRQERFKTVGFGAIALKFINRQFVFGFDLKPLSNRPAAGPIAQVAFFAIDGTPIGVPVILTRFTTYTFLTPDKARDIKGIEITNLGAVPFGIDRVVFELPLITG